MIAYENARLFAQVQQMATTDELTGIANRSSLLRVGRATRWTQARRDGRPLAAMMIDIDHFKWVNDTYGHQVGDEVIQAVADRLGQVADRPTTWSAATAARSSRSCCRRTTIDAVATAERLRRAVAPSPVPTGAGPLDVTVSVGVTYLRADDPDLADVLARADRCLLQAKRAGRDQVLVD